MKRNLIIFLAGWPVVLATTSCKKYLDAKSDTALSTVTSVNSAQQILDNSDRINGQSLYYGEYSCDNYYYDQATYDSQVTDIGLYGNLYTWGKYLYLGYDPSTTQWAQAYAAIMIANTALNGIRDIPVDNLNLQSYNNVKGTALAFRAYNFWMLSTTFSKSYNPETSNTDLGIPLRMDININEKTTRGTVQQAYDQIIKDLVTALPLLPSKAAYITRPSKASTYAMLAEVYLSMRMYNKAYSYADSSLSLKHDLIDYNTLNASSTAPVPVFKDNTEILTFFACYNTSIQYPNALIDSTLFASYKNIDLRKRFLFGANSDSTHFFSGTYAPNGNPFTGPTTAEMYLTRAECLARQGNTTDAMADLNTLMKNRIDHSISPFVPYTATSSAEALQIILQERRKELVFRDLRWMDIKRLNLEGANIIITRNINGKTFRLQPNDNRYAIQIPPEVVQLSGVPQNPY